MPAWSATLGCAFAAAAFFTIIGLPLARVLVPCIPAIGLAPSLGWAMFSVVALPVLSLVGFGFATVIALCLASLVAALVVLSRTDPMARMPPWAVALACCVALFPLMAILPKPVDDGVLLGPPMFDHVKIAIVDAILRSGLPVRNPFVGGSGSAPSPLNYYYLWHFSAATLGEALRVDGWTADAAMTGFTAFASLLLMMAIAQVVGGGAVGSVAVVLLSLPGSLRPLIDVALGHQISERVMPGSADLSGWLYQSAWVPQHLASACCVVLAVLLLPGLAGKRPVLDAGVLGLVVAAGFQSSAWVGGIAFAAAAPSAGLVLLTALRRRTWKAVALLAVAAAILACALSARFIAEQIASVAARHGGSPIAFVPYGVLGPAVPAGWRAALDIPAFWLLLLPFGLPALVPFGTAAIVAAWRGRHAAAGSMRTVAAPLGAGACACLAVAWLFRSTIDNNDLGWRAVLPPILVMTAFSAGLAGRLVAARRWRALAAAAGPVVLGLPAAFLLLQGYVGGQHPGAATPFARSAGAWSALRHVAALEDRVADNPLLAAASTPWPVNIAWALLSDRPSCYAGWSTVLAYGALPREEVADRSARFQRVFAGSAQPGDVAKLAWTYDCRAALVVPGDGAWANDPFAASSAFRLADETRDWRVYVRTPPR